MSEHITGHVGNTINQDFGEFITILDDVRVRRDLVCAYRLAGPIKDEGQPHDGMYSVNFMIQQGWNATRPFSKAECEIEIARLDWIYQKENNK